MKILINGKIVELNQGCYIGQGGQSQVFSKNGLAYKIYHDCSKLPPIGKLKELSGLKDIKNILVPHEIAYDIKGNAVGFVMPFVDRTEYLCKLFNKGFKIDNKLSPQDITDLVKRAYDTLKLIHERKFLVVDYNPYNFLTSRAFDEYYHIDCDSYATLSYKADALMDSVRDWTIKNNEWTEFSDWLSWSVVMFELFTNCHPYKGKIAGFGKDWMARMKSGSNSVFNKNATLPPNTESFSVIPPALRKYFEDVFEHGFRGIPPCPDQTLPILPAPIQIISGTETFNLKLIRTYVGDIETIRFINGICYCFTNQHIYAENKILWTHSILKQKRLRHDFCYAQNADPVLLEFNGITNKLTCKSFDGAFKIELTTDGYFVSNDKLYCAINNNLVEYSFMNLGAKLIASQRIVANIFHSRIVFKGMVAQDLLGTCHLCIPNISGECAILHLKELDKNRLVFGKYQKNFAIIVSEKEGKLRRSTICFDEKFQGYDIRIEEDIVLVDLQFTVLDKGICVAAYEDTIELFFDNTKIKKVGHSPITGGQQLISFGNIIQISNKNEIFEVHLK